MSSSLRWTFILSVALTATGSTEMKGEQHMQFFRTQQKQGHWWLIAPDGAQFISRGVDTVRFASDRVQPTESGSYAETVLAKYASFDEWSEAVARALFGWGFNTLGGASDERVSNVEVDGRRLAYTPIISIGSRFVSQSTGGSAWRDGFFPDVFDPEFEKTAKEIAIERCSPRKDDPMLLGWFIDNELRWGPDWRGQDELLTVFLAMPKETPGRIAAIDLLRERYGDVAEFNKVWGTDFDSWDEAPDAGSIRPPVELKGVWVQNQEVERRARQDNPRHAAFLADCDAFLERVAEGYFRITDEAIKAAAPNHLNLGCRFAYVPARPVLEAAARYVDVISFNCYHNDPRETIEAYAEFGKPVLVGEFSFKGADSGLPNTRGAGALVNTQAERAAAFKNFVSLALSNPSFVGYHWFRHSDQPKDSTGENSNYGVMDYRDQPWKLLTKTMTEVNAEAEIIHETRFAKVRTYFEVDEPAYVPNIDGQYGERRYGSIQTFVARTNPDSTTLPIRIRLLIENVCEQPTTGKLSLNIKPAGSAIVEGFDDSYALAPAEKKIIPLTCTVQPYESETTLTAVSQEIYDRAISVTIMAQGRFSISQLETVPELQTLPEALQNEKALPLIAGDVKLADVRYALAGNKIAVHATVFDRSVTPDNPEWVGNLDVLFSLPEKGTVHQVVFIPKGEAAAREVRLHRNGERLPDPEVQWTTEVREDYGYILTALIPLESVKISKDRPFMMEAAVVAPLGEGAPRAYITMFGSENAYFNDLRFGVFEPDPEQ